tara:strand:+ start:61 stop:738 length:678 start_codon:yes stop_codon:yes gene_type:complete
MSKRLGIIGGLGPETSCQFCLGLNKTVRGKTSVQPNIVMENVPISEKIEHQLIAGKEPEEMHSILKEAVRTLNQAETDFIVIPCNTVHVFIDSLRNESVVPILSIIEECAKECQLRGFSKVGLLGTKKTVKSRMYEKELKQLGINLVLPNHKDQEIVCNVIKNILGNKQSEKDTTDLIKVVNNLDADAAILGCTDLQLAVNNGMCNIPLLDSCTILENNTAKLLL